MVKNAAILIAVCLVGIGAFVTGYTAGGRAGHSSAASAAARQGLLHVFAYTPLAGATEQDFALFDQATRDMVGKIPGLRKVWVGKLFEPLPWEDKVRTYGVGMEFDDKAALDVYAKHPVHDDWVKVYTKVREQGTTTLDIVE